MPKYRFLLSKEEREAEKERKENLRNLMAGLDVKNFNDLQELFKMMVGEVLENGLEGELEDELGYSKYDYRNKETENSRNGYSNKRLMDCQPFFGVCEKKSVNNIQNKLSMVKYKKHRRLILWQN